MSESPGAQEPIVFTLVAIAASAGGLTAIDGLLSGLPDTFPVPVLVVQHLSPQHQSLIVPILARHTALRVVEARQGDQPSAGTVYVAPRDCHLVLGENGALDLTHSPPRHFVRPSADQLFESSAAFAHGPVIAVVLSGSGVDGAEGAQAVKSHGGLVIAEDGTTALYSGMPHAAIATGAVDHVLPLQDIAGLLMKLTSIAQS